MLKHIVLWKFKDEACGQSKAENMDMMRAKLLALPPIIDCIRDFEIGEDVYHSDKSYDMCLVSAFDSVDAMLEYREHPDHAAVSAQMKELVEARVVIDFVVTRDF